MPKNQPCENIMFLGSGISAVTLAVWGVASWSGEPEFEVPPKYLKEEHWRVLGLATILLGTLFAISLLPPLRSSKAVKLYVVIMSVGAISAILGLMVEPLRSIAKREINEAANKPEWDGLQGLVFALGAGAGLLLVQVGMMAR